MVTNSFRKRNFMLPMGRPKHGPKVPRFFHFKFRGGGGGFFFIFPWFLMYSHYVRFKFSMGSHHVPNMFLKFPMCSPTCSPSHLPFIRYALANVVLLSPI
jgi:hypothetical protein